MGNSAHGDPGTEPGVLRALTLLGVPGAEPVTIAVGKSVSLLGRCRTRRPPPSPSGFIIHDMLGVEVMVQERDTYKCFRADTESYHDTHGAVPRGNSANIFTVATSAPKDIDPET